MPGRLLDQASVTDRRLPAEAPTRVVAKPTVSLPVAGIAAADGADGRPTAGRPADIRAFRRNLVAGRLGLSFSLVPTDPAELVDTITRLSTQGGGGRLATDAMVAPPTAITDADRDAWNRDGSQQTGFNPVAWLTLLAADVRSRLENEVPAGP